MPAAAKKRHEYTASELISALRGLHIAGADLRQLVELTQEAIGDELDRRVKGVKAGAPGLPEGVIAQTLVRGECRCINALRWLAND